MNYFFRLVSIFLWVSIYYPINAQSNKVAKVAGSTRPVAGILCFTSNLPIVKNIDTTYREKYIKQRDEFIESEWQKQWKETTKDVTSKKKISKSALAYLTRKFEVNKTVEKDSLLQTTQIEYQLNYKNTYQLDSQLRTDMWHLNSVFDSLSNLLEKDTTVDLDLKNKLLIFCKNAFNNDEQIDLINLKNDLWEKTIKENLNCRNLVVYINISKNRRIYIDLLKEEYRKANINLFRLEEKLRFALLAKHSFDFEIEHVELEFNEGVINNILVVGNIVIMDLSAFDDPKRVSKIIYPNNLNAELSEGGLLIKKIKLENKHPFGFGFSRKISPELLSKNALIIYGKNNEEEYKLDIRDLLSLYLPPKKGDHGFIPQSHLLLYNPLYGDGCFPLYEEEVAKLFEARIFTDLLGFKENVANGLFQTEVSKRLNIYSKNTPVGFLNWVEPSITISKIEQTNKNLILSSSVLADSNGRILYYTTPLDIRKHESLSVGTSASLYSYGFQQIKSVFSINCGLYYRRTPITIDSIAKDKGINALTGSPEIVWEFRPDNRYWFSLSLGNNFVKTLNRGILQISNLQNPIAQPIVIKKSHSYSTIQIQAFFQPSEETQGRLFFRYRYHWQLGVPTQYFFQVQLGYSFTLLGRKNEVKG